MRPRALLFCNHLVARLEYDAHLASAAQQAFGVETIVLTHGARAVERALAVGFDRAIDVSFKDGRVVDSPATVRAELAALEDQSGGRSLLEDIKQDRWLAGRFSLDWSLRYLVGVKRTMELLLAERDVVAGVGEVNYAAYRLVRRMLALEGRPYLMAAWARAFDRFYLDPSFYSAHERCVRRYEAFRLSGVPADARDEAERAIHRIAGLRQGPNYQAAAVGVASARAPMDKVRKVVRYAFGPSGASDGPPAGPRKQDRTIAALVARSVKAGQGRRRYARLATADVPQAPCALYLLHTNPEYQVNTCGWPFRDEVFLVERIAESLPLDMPLLVKEHLLMLGRRSARDYDRLAAIPNVRFVPADANARELISAAAVVFTISGNGAVEALACRVPAIVFSPVFYTKFEGITRCSNLLELPELIHERLHAERVSKEAVAAAFAAMYSASRPGTPFKPNGAWNHPANMQLLHDGFIAELRELVPALENAAYSDNLSATKQRAGSVPTGRDVSQTGQVVIASQTRPEAPEKESGALSILVVTETLPFPPRNGVELPIAKFTEAFAAEFICDILVIGADARDFEQRRPNVPGTVREVLRVPAGQRSMLGRILKEVFGLRPAYTRGGFDSREVSRVFAHRSYDWLWVSPVGCMGFVDTSRRLGFFRRARVAVGLNDVTTMLYLDNAREFLTGRIGFAFKRGLRGLRLPWVYLFERRVLAGSDVVHVQTELESRRAAGLLGRQGARVCILDAQNGRDDELMEAVPAGADSHDILYMTQLRGGRKNESRWFLDNVWPLIRDQDPEAVLHLVGTAPLPGSDFHTRDLSRVVIHGYADNLVDVYSRMRVAVLPILHSTGLINRLLDALTAGLPIVSTPGPLRTVSGLIPGRHAVSAATPEQFASAVLRLLADTAYWESLCVESRKLARQQPSWSDTTARVLETIRSLAPQPARKTAFTTSN